MNNLQRKTLADYLVEYDDVFVGYLQLFQRKYVERQSKQLVLTVYDQEGLTLMQLYADNVDGLAEDLRPTNIYLSRYRDVKYDNTYEGYMCKNMIKNKPLVDVETLKVMAEEGVSVDFDSDERSVFFPLDFDGSSSSDDDDDEDIEINSIDDVLSLLKPEDIDCITLQIVDSNMLSTLVENTI